MHQFYTFLFIAWLTFVLNIPLGMWRYSVKKLSISWFIALHMSIPVIVSFRIHAGLDVIYIPAVIIVAVIGQRVGGQILKKIKLDPQESLNTHSS